MRFLLEILNQNLLKPINFPNCKFLSPISEPPDFFKYVEII